MNIIMEFSAPRGVRELFVVALILVFGSSVARGQDGARSSPEGKAEMLTIVNPSQLEIPDKRARVLLLTTCRVVAEKFHQKPKQVEITMTLVLGAWDEHYAIDKTGRMTMYLEHWDEGKFVDGVIISAVQWMASLQMRNQMLTEIVRRTDPIVPVSANQLRRPAEKPSLQTEGPYPACAIESGTARCSTLTQPRPR